MNKILEWLINWGWVILIVIIVAAALYALGIFDFLKGIA